MARHAERPQATQKPRQQQQKNAQIGGASRPAPPPAPREGESSAPTRSQKSVPSRARVGKRPLTGGTQPNQERVEIDANEFLRQQYESPDLLEPEVLESFVESSALGQEGVLRRRLSQNQEGPDISAGDIDAAWERADVGEETVAGSSPTPDQDIVEEIGEALGVTYQDAEPLRMEEKLAKRDDSRWELAPASDQDYAERAREQENLENKKRNARKQIER